MICRKFFTTVNVIRKNIVYRKFSDECFGPFALLTAIKVIALVVLISISAVVSFCLLTGGKYAA
ncbi:hypothetical protein NIAHE148_38570 [Escherichia coli]|nr:hypothetical protein NIAHE148_38570 [Escherichia coli]